MQLNCSINVEALQELIAYLNRSNDDLDVVLADVASQISDLATRDAYITLALKYLKKDNPTNDIIKDIAYTNHVVSKYTTNPNYRKDLSLDAHKLAILDKLNKQYNNTTPEKEELIAKINKATSKKELMDIHIGIMQISPTIQAIIQSTEEEEKVLPISEQRLVLVKHIEEKKQAKEDLAQQITLLENTIDRLLNDIGEQEAEFNRLVELAVNQETITDEEIKVANEEKTPDTTIKEHIQLSFKEYLRDKYKGGLKGLFKRIKDKLRKILFVINLASIMTLHITKDINLSNYRNDIKTKYEQELNIQLKLDTTTYKHGIEYKQTDNYRVDSLGNKIDNKPSVIVLHHTGEYKNGLRSVFNEFTIKGGNSSHFVIGKNGKVYQFNDGSYILFHAGKSIFNSIEDVNSYSIGIEMEGDSNLSDLTKEQYESLILLLHDLAKTYNIPIDNITSHAAIRNAYLQAHPEDKETQGKADLSEEVFSKVIKAIQINYPKQRVIERAEETTTTEEQDSTPISNTLKIIAALQTLDIAIRAYRRRKTNSLVVDEEKEVSNSKVEEAMDTIEKDKIIAIIEELRKSLIEQREELEKLRNKDKTYDKEILFLQKEIANLVEKQIIEPTNTDVIELNEETELVIEPITEETIINTDDSETLIPPPVIIPLTENKTKQKRITTQEIIQDLKKELESATKEADKAKLQKRIAELEDKLYNTKINNLEKVIEKLVEDKDKIKELSSSSKSTKTQEAKLQKYKDTVKDIVENNDIDLLLKLSTDSLSFLYHIDSDFRYGDSDIVNNIEDLEINKKWLAIFTNTNNTIEIEKLNERLNRSTKKTDWSINSWQTKTGEVLTIAEIKAINVANTSFNKKLELILNTVPIEDVVIVEENTPTDENTILVKVSEHDIANKKAILERVVTQLTSIKEYGTTFGKALVAIENELSEEQAPIVVERLNILKTAINEVWIKNPDDMYDVIAEKILRVKNNNTSELSNYQYSKKKVTITPINKNGTVAPNVVVIKILNKEEVYYYTNSQLILKDDGIERHLYYTDDNKPIDVKSINEKTQKGVKIVVSKEGNLTTYFATVDTNGSLVYKVNHQYRVSPNLTVSNIVNYNNLIVNAHKLPTINNNSLSTQYTPETLSRAINDLYAFRNKANDEYKTKLDNYINSNWNNPAKLIGLRDKLVKGLTLHFIPTDYDIEHKDNSLVIYDNDGVVVFMNSKEEVVDEATYEAIKREKEANIPLNKNSNLEAIKHPYIYHNIDKKSKQELVSEYKGTIDKLNNINKQKDLKEQTITINTSLSDTEVRILLLLLANNYTIYIGDELYTNNGDMTKYDNTEEKQLRFKPIFEIIPVDIEPSVKDAVRKTLTPILNSPAVPLADNQRDYVNEGDNLLYSTDYYDSALQMTVKFSQTYNDNYKNGLLEKLTSDITDTQVQIYMPMIESIEVPTNNPLLQKEINDLLVTYNKANTNEEKFTIYKDIVRRQIKALIDNNKNNRTRLLEKGRYTDYHQHDENINEDTFLDEVYPAMLVPLTYRNIVNGNIYGTVHTYEYILNPHKFVQKIGRNPNPAVATIIAELKEIRSNNPNIYKNVYMLKTYFNEETISNTGYPLRFANDEYREVKQVFGDNSEVLSIRKNEGVWYINNYTEQEYNDNVADTNKAEAVNKLLEVLAKTTEDIPNTTTYYIMPVKVNTLITKTTNLAPYYIYNVYTKKFNEYTNEDKVFLGLGNVDENSSLVNIVDKLKFFRLRIVKSIDDSHDFDATPLIYKYNSYNDTKTKIYIIKYRVKEGNSFTDKQITIEIEGTKTKYKINNSTYTSESEKVVEVKKDILAILGNTRIYIDSNIVEIHSNKNHLFVTDINGTNTHNNINMVFVNPTYTTHIIDNTTIEPHVEKTETVIMDSKTIDNTPIPLKTISREELKIKLGEDNLSEVVGNTFEYTDELQEKLEACISAFDNNTGEAKDILDGIISILTPTDLTPDCTI